MVGPEWVPRVSPKWAPCGPLANSAWAPHGQPITAPTGHPHGAHLWPIWAALVGPRWVHGGTRIDPTCIAQMGPLWPPGQFCVGPAWAAHNWPYGPPSWDPPVARMGCPCGAQMGPWWGPDGSHVYRPNGPLVAPLANSAWVPCGRPTWGPQGHPHGANMGPRRYCWLGREYEVYTFRQAKENMDEDMTTYYTRLRQLSSTCEFTDVDREIQSQIIQNCSSSRLRRKAQ